MLPSLRIVIRLSVLGLLLVVVSTGLERVIRQRQHERVDRQMQAAIIAGNSATVRILLREEPASGYPELDENMPPLEVAAMYGRDSIVKLLLDANADVAQVSGWGTALESAVRAGHLSTVRLLVARGALRDTRKVKLDRALWIAAMEGQIGIVSYLLREGADPDQAGRDGVALIDAVRRTGSIAVVRELARFQRGRSSSTAGQLPRAGP